jgi:O-antigen/teichoic acid export membrane protein
VHAGLLAAFSVVPQTLQAVGKGRVVLENGLLALGLYIPGFFFFGTQFGARGLAIAWCVGTPLLLARLWTELSKAVNIERGSLWRILWAPTAATAAMSVAVVLSRRALQPVVGVWATLALIIVIGVVSYAITLALLDPVSTRTWLGQVRLRKSAAIPSLST